MMMYNNNYRINTNTRAIYKYELPQQGYIDLKGCFSNVMHLGEQDNQLYVWIERSLTKTDFHTGKQVPREEKEEKTYRFSIIGTGQSYSPSEIGMHIGTVQMRSGFVWHIFMKEVEE